MNDPRNYPPRDLYITLDLHRRVPGAVDHYAEKIALQDIAAQMLDQPEQLLPKLVQRAMQMTGAVSAGISAFEEKEGTPGIFRWRNLHGDLARFEGTTTPRDYSPCGVCLDRFEPTLTRHPERYYSWISDAGVVCPEVLLVPLYMARGQLLGTLWIVSEAEGYFDSGHARVMRELASFVGIALVMVQSQQRLEAAMVQQELLTAEMDHRVKNLFSVVDAMIYATQRSARSTGDFASILRGRLHALSSAHSLVRHSLRRDAETAIATSLREVIEAVLKPYETVGEQRLQASGDHIAIGDRAASGLALVFHELATNAAKYGALSHDRGGIEIAWHRRGDDVEICWSETGGSGAEKEPERLGFGSKLVRNTVVGQFGGQLDLQWRDEGLRAIVQLPLAELSH